MTNGPLLTAFLAVPVDIIGGCLWCCLMPKTDSSPVVHCKGQIIAALQAVTLGLQHQFAGPSNHQK